MKRKVPTEFIVVLALVMVIGVVWGLVRLLAEFIRPQLAG